MKVAGNMRWMCFVLLGLSWFGGLAAQEADTLRVAAPQDSPAAAPDTLQILPVPARSGISDPIRYTAESITFLINEKTTELQGGVRIVYGNLTLEAARVQIIWPENLMIAEAVADSVDSLGNPVMRGFPVLSEKGEQPISGKRLEYSFATQRGKIQEGRTNMEPGYYRGSDVRKVGDETLLIKDAYFTSCDLEDHPHFYFRSQKMRMRVKQTAIARPIVLYIADVPILAAPFAFFSLKRGRRSGLILPTYGESSQAGRNLQDFGYYWAASEYWDATLLGNFYEKTGTSWSGNLNYKKRYSLDGSIRARFAPKDVLTGEKRQRWEVNFNHSHKVGENTDISGSGSFVSDKDFRRDLSEDISSRLDQKLRTNFTIRRRLPGSRQLSLAASRDENLQTGEIGYTLPDLRFSQPTRSVIPVAGGSSNKNWYNNIQYSYNTNLKSFGEKTVTETDSLTGESVRFDDSRTSGWEHRVGLSMSGLKVLKYFKINPTMSFSELWLPRSLDYSLVDSTQTLKADTVEGFRARHTYSSALSMSTTLYGLWEIPFSPLKVIRHKIDPSIGFSYTPDFGGAEYDYYQTFQTSDGRTLRGDRFSRPVNPFGGTPSGESRSLTMRVSNLFQGKMIRGGEEKKVDLLRVNMNTAYNFAADSLRLNNLSTSISAKPVQNFSVDFSSIHSFYQSSSPGKRIDRYVWDSGFQLPDLQSYRISANSNFSLRPSAPDKEKEAKADSLQQEKLFGQNALNGSQRRRLDDFDEFKGLDIPWSLSVALSYSLNRDVNANKTWNFDSFINGRLQLTKKWQINYSTQVDLRERLIDRQEFRITRDLHCWTMNFRWTPNPSYSSYRLEIRVNESALRDLKVTKTSSGRRPFN